MTPLEQANADEDARRELFDDIVCRGEKQDPKQTFEPGDIVEVVFISDDDDEFTFEAAARFFGRRGRVVGPDEDTLDGVVVEFRGHRGNHRDLYWPEELRRRRRLR